jgi:predicted PurR-regulated permease PerM
LKILLIKIETIANDKGYELDLSREHIVGFLKDNTKEISGKVMKSLGGALKKSFTGFASILLFFINLFLFPMFFFFIINDYEKITSSIESIVPKTFLEKFRTYEAKASDIFSGYIRGQLIVAMLLGVLYSIGLVLSGLKFGLLIGLIGGILSIIPYAGFFIGFSMAIIVAISNSAGIGVFIGIGVTFAIVQALEGTVITPKLVGDKVGLSTLTTMLALMIGGNLFGMPGMIIAIPAAALIKEATKELIIAYKSSEFYLQN